MSAYMLQSKVSLLNHINAKNATTFALTDLVFSAPQVINGTWRDLANPHNTAVRVTASETSVFQGTQVVTYDRLKLSDLAHLPGFTLRADKPTSVYSLLDGLLYYNGLHFTSDDLEDTPVTDNGDGTFTATLTAKPGSYGWIGSYTLTITQGAAALDNAITEPNLDGLNYPTDSDADIYAALYLYGYDFTANYADLVDFEEDVPLDQHQAAALVAAIKAQDISSGKDLWNADGGSTSWSLAGAIPRHNGLNSSSLPTNAAYKYAVVLEFRAGVTTPRGNLIMHYNDPVDSGSV